MRKSDSDELFVCPYDPVHRISAKRYVGHIMKCKKNHPGADKVILTCFISVLQINCKLLIKKWINALLACIFINPLI